MIRAVVVGVLLFLACFNVVALSTEGDSFKNDLTERFEKCILIVEKNWESDAECVSSLVGFIDSVIEHLSQPVPRFVESLKNVGHWYAVKTGQKNNPFELNYGPIFKPLSKNLRNGFQKHRALLMALYQALHNNPSRAKETKRKDIEEAVMNIKEHKPKLVDLIARLEPK